jgi:hypothetical protein
MPISSAGFDEFRKTQQTTGDLMLRSNYGYNYGDAIAIRLPRKDAKKLRSEAKASASAKWTPQADQREPSYLGVWNNTIWAAQARQREIYHQMIEPDLECMERWLSTPAVEHPPPQSIGTRARAQAKAADGYKQLTTAKDHAMTRYEQARKALIERLDQLERRRHGGRQLYWTTLTRHHQNPGAVGEAPPQAPSELDVKDPIVVVDTRRRTQEERSRHPQQVWGLRRDLSELYDAPSRLEEESLCST